MKVINFPAVKKDPVKAAVLKAIDLEYIQQAILDNERLDVLATLSLQESIPEEMHALVIEASVALDMAVGKMLAWVKVRNPAQYKKYLHKSAREIREMPPISEVQA